MQLANLLFTFACAATELPQKTHDEVSQPKISTLFAPQLKTLGATEITDIPGGKVGQYVHGENTWAIAMQNMPQRDLVYLSINRYLNIDLAHSNAASVLTLTQLATLNHEMFGVKFQLNPDNGAITISSELSPIDTITQSHLNQSAAHLIQVATDRYSTLKGALEMGQF